TERDSDCPIDSPGARVSLPVGSRNLISPKGDGALEAKGRNSEHNLEAQLVRDEPILAAPPSFFALRLQGNLIKQVFPYTGDFSSQRGSTLDRQLAQQQLKHPTRLIIHGVFTLRRLPPADDYH